LIVSNAPFMVPESVEALEPFAREAPGLHNTVSARLRRGC
jgi:hypothetical protein